LAACAILLPQFLFWRVGLLLGLVAVAGLASAFVLEAFLPFDDRAALLRSVHCGAAKGARREQSSRQLRTRSNRHRDQEAASSVYL
jgi:hypothetical protein